MVPGVTELHTAMILFSFTNLHFLSLANKESKLCSCSCKARSARRILWQPVSCLKVCRIYPDSLPLSRPTCSQRVECTTFYSYFVRLTGCSNTSRNQIIFLPKYLIIRILGFFCIYNNILKIVEYTDVQEVGTDFI